jgi:hypothetical protein
MAPIRTAIKALASAGKAIQIVTGPIGSKTASTPRMFSFILPNSKQRSRASISR